MNNILYPHCYNLDDTWGDSKVTLHHAHHLIDHTNIKNNFNSYCVIYKSAKQYFGAKTTKIIL